MQVQLQLKQYQFQYKEDGPKRYIFDPVRKKYVALTPEEWVRQHMIRYLMEEKKYPRSLISVERSLLVNGLSCRTDVVAYDRSGTPTLLLECKAPEVKLTQKTFEQAAKYNLTLKVPFLVISNGSHTYCCRIDLKNSGFEFLEEIPEFAA